MADTTDNYQLKSTSGKEVEAKSTVVAGVHTPHMIAEPSAADPMLKAYTQWLLGGSDGAVAALTAGATVVAAPADLTLLHSTRGTLYLIVSGVSNSPDIDVTMSYSEDGITELGNHANNVFDNITVNGIYPVDLDTLPYNHFPVFKAIERAGGSAAANIRLVIMARGGA